MDATSWLIDGKRRPWTLLNEVPDSLPCTDGTAACVYFHPSGGLQTSTLLITLFWQGIKITENNLWVTDLTGIFATTQSYPLFNFFLSLSLTENLLLPNTVKFTMIIWWNETVTNIFFFMSLFIYPPPPTPTHKFHILFFILFSRSSPSSMLSVFKFSALSRNLSWISTHPLVKNHYNSLFNYV